MNKLLIYTEQKSNRLTYIFDFLLTELLGLNYELTQDIDTFTSHEGPKFSYASQPIADELFFEAVPFLYETDLVLQPVDFCEYGKSTGFYIVSERSLMPFDVFASAFFMLSCYNEYLLNKKDKYDRYRASQSMNYRAGFLDKPMINYYALDLKKILSDKYPELVFKKNNFEYLPTFDIDMAYSFREKGFAVNLGGFLRAFLLSDFKEIKSRYGVLFRNKKDPFDNFDFILGTCKKYALKTLFFFLVGEKSQFDKNISVENETFRDLIKDVSEQADVGVHLSFRSHISNDVMHTEIDRLEEITGKKITSNRFHYLRFIIPASYMRLIKIGITEEYSMGHASRVGFRAATCTPFYFFNLIKNEKSPLKIYPFAFMDTTFTHYNRLNAEEAQEKILQMMKYVKEVEGPFIGLWHNSSFCEERQWKGWKEVFEAVAENAMALTKEE